MDSKTNGVSKLHLQAVLILVTLLVFAVFPLAAQSSSLSAGAHRGAVNVIALSNDGYLFSGGADGFLVRWDTENSRAVERFQASSWGITQIAFPPADETGASKPYIALAESNGSNTYLVSVWDYRTRTRLFSVRFKDPVNVLSYSGAGSYLLVSTGGAAGIILLDAESGAPLENSPYSGDRISFAATGKSEKTMITYSPAGFLSYWDLGTGEEIRRFRVARNLTSPVLFGSRRFLAGIASDGLTVLDAVSGTLIAREKIATRGKLAVPDPESTELYCLAQSGQTAFYHLFLTIQGKLDTLEKKTAASPLSGVTCFFPWRNEITAGTSAGMLWKIPPDDKALPYGAGTQLRLTEAAVSGSTLAFLGEGNILGWVPLDYRKLTAGSVLDLQSHEGYTRIAVDASADPVRGNPRFLFWQSANTRLFPALFTLAPDEGGQGVLTRQAVLNKLPLRAALRSVSVRGEEALFLTSRGALSSVSLEGGETVPTGLPLENFQTPGITSAVFLNNETILLSQNSVSGSPFETLARTTGEIAALKLEPAAGLGIYGAPSGALYACSADRSSTRIISLTGGNTSSVQLVAELPGEDLDVNVAECGVPASTLGNETVTAYTKNGPLVFERSAGFPAKLLGGGGTFIVLDTEGTLLWYDPAAGKILAALTLERDTWFLDLREASRRTLSGPIRGIKK